MYNLPEMRALNAAFWGALRVELIRSGLESPPEALDFERKPVPAEIEADTLFTQVCGLGQKRTSAHFLDDVCFIPEKRTFRTMPVIVRFMPQADMGRSLRNRPT